MTMMGSIIKCVAVSWSLSTRPPYTDTIYQEGSSWMGKSCINPCISSPLPAQEVGAFTGYAESTQDGALPGLPIWPPPSNISLALAHIYSLLPPHTHTHSYRHILLSLSFSLMHPPHSSQAERIGLCMCRLLYLRGQHDPFFCKGANSEYFQLLKYNHSGNCPAKGHMWMSMAAFQ